MIFNQKAWLTSHLDMNAELRKNAKNDLGKHFFKLMNNAVFGKTMKNVRNPGEIKLIKIKARRKYLVSEPNYYTEKVFSDNSLPTEMQRTHILMSKPVSLGLSILKISTIVMYEFWYDYVKPKYGAKAKLFYMETDNFLVYIKTEDVYVIISKDVETRCHTSNYALDRPLSKEKDKKVIGLMKD